MLQTVGGQAQWLVEYRRRCPEQTFEQLATEAVEEFFDARRDYQRPAVRWFCEDPGYWLDRRAEQRETRRQREELEAFVAQQREAKKRAQREEAERLARAERLQRERGGDDDLYAPILHLIEPHTSADETPAANPQPPPAPPQMTAAERKKRLRLLQQQREQIRRAGGDS